MRPELSCWAAVHLSSAAATRHHLNVIHVPLTPTNKDYGCNPRHIISCLLWWHLQIDITLHSSSVYNREHSAFNKTWMGDERGEGELIDNLRRYVSR